MTSLNLKNNFTSNKHSKRNSYQIKVNLIRLLEIQIKKNKQNVNSLLEYVEYIKKILMIIIDKFLRFQKRFSKARNKYFCFFLLKDKCFNKNNKRNYFRNEDLNGFLRKRKS